VNFVKFDRRFRLVEVELDLDSNLPAIVLVADHAVQVAMNLLINAADALADCHQRAPKIRLTSSVEGGQARVCVIDNGVGIPEEILPHVFEERFSTKGPGRGSGLGLSVCRSLLDKVGGTISITSEVGVGTTLDIRFPIPLLGEDCR
jgi:signal transduction histidine kinase